MQRVPNESITSKLQNGDKSAHLMDQLPIVGERDGEGEGEYS